MKKFFLFVLAAVLMACCNKDAQVAQTAHPDWAYNSTIYELNTRQFTPEGTFAAAEAELPTLKELGVDIIWVMPIQPIGKITRKGSLGSYYSIIDYCDFNPEFGTREDFESFVATAHKLDMFVILDWVANHTAPDSKWTENEGWHYRDSLGNLMVQYDWTDISKLDYHNSDMRAEMKRCMRWWMEEIGIDGFRCDVAHQIPVAFWKPMFERFRKDFPGTYYLAEGENPELHHAFDASYAWELHHLMNDVAQGKQAAKELSAYILKDDSIAKTVPANYWRLTFTSNHDENSWAGTEMARMGESHRLMAMLTFTLPHSQPLIYTGQEVGFDHRFEFFDKDESPVWTANDYTDFYAFLSELRHTHPALAPEAAFELIPFPSDSCLAFRRIAGTDTVSVFANLSHTPVTYDDTLVEPSQAVLALSDDYAF